MNGVMERDEKIGQATISEKMFIPALLEENKKLNAYPFKGYWKDVGTVRSLWEANMDLAWRSSSARPVRRNRGFIPSPQSTAAVRCRAGGNQRIARQRRVRRIWGCHPFGYISARCNRQTFRDQTFSRDA